MANNHDAPPRTADQIPVEELIASDIVRKARVMIQRKMPTVVIHDNRIMRSETLSFIELIEEVLKRVS